MKPFASLLINSLVLALFSVVMLLVMIWPMGSKPRGAELFCLAFLFAALLFTEFSLLLEIRRK